MIKFPEYTPVVYISPEALFKIHKYRGLSLDQQWKLAFDEGWHFDHKYNKFYK